MTDREERIRRARERAQTLRGIKVEHVAAPYLFQTPREVVKTMIDYADLEPGMSVLEPSAGTGSIIAEIPLSCPIVAVEVNSALASLLRAQGRALVVESDFLTLDPGTLGRFDRILMNPPFDHGVDIKHILHAQKFLKPDGRLVAICADGPKQREEFDGIAYLYESLPAGTFADAGTNVNTAIVVLGGIHA
jgi:predicted RNA methylase